MSQDPWLNTSSGPVQTVMGAECQSAETALSNDSSHVHFANFTCHLRAHKTLQRPQTLQLEGPSKHFCWNALHVAAQLCFTAFSGFPHACILMQADRTLQLPALSHAPLQTTQLAPTQPYAHPGGPAPGPGSSFALLGSCTGHALALNRLLCYLADGAANVVSTVLTLS